MLDIKESRDKRQKNEESSTSKRKIIYFSQEKIKTERTNVYRKLK